MATFLEDIDQLYLVERLIRKEKVVRDRSNPFTAYSDDEFIDRFRLTKECVIQLDDIGEYLEPKQKKMLSISPLNQFLIALRFYATGCFFTRVWGFIRSS